MEKFEEHHGEIRHGSGSGMTRRNFLKILGIGGAASIGMDAKKVFGQEAPSRYSKDGWWYTPEEMQRVYDQEYNGEKILKNIFQKSGDGYIGLVEGKELLVPEIFFDQLLAHLREMLEKKATRFLFRLDAFHGHFIVPEEAFKESYGAVGMYKDAARLISDPRLGALYHNSEHLKFEKGDYETAMRHAKRNVIGFWDGRPLEYLPLPKGKSTNQDIPNGKTALEPFLVFAAHKDGVFALAADAKEIRLDISFDDKTYF